MGHPLSQYLEWLLKLWIFTLRLAHSYSHFYKVLIADFAVLELHQEILYPWRDLAIHNEVVGEVSTEIQLVGLHDLHQLIQLLIAEEPVLYQGVHQFAELTTLRTIGPALLCELLEQREQLSLLDLMRLIEVYLIAQQPNHQQHLLVTELGDSRFIYFEKDLLVDL